jgi:hypothetical protein
VTYENGVAFTPDKVGNWDLLNDVGRLSCLENWVNWDGVSRRDKTRLFAREVDPEKLPSGVRTLFFGNDCRYGPDKDEPDAKKGTDLEPER